MNPMHTLTKSEYKRYCLELLEQAISEYKQLGSDDQEFVSRNLLPVWMKVAKLTTNTSWEKNVAHFLSKIKDKDVPFDIAIALLQTADLKQDMHLFQEAVATFQQTHEGLFGGFQFLDALGEIVGKMVKNNNDLLTQYLDVVDTIKTDDYYLFMFSFLVRFVGYYDTEQVDENLKRLLDECINRLKKKGMSQGRYLSGIVSTLYFAPVKKTKTYADGLYRICKKILILDERLKSEGKVGLLYHDLGYTQRAEEILHECTLLLEQPESVDKRLKSTFKINMERFTPAKDILKIARGKLIPLREKVDDKGQPVVDTVSLLDLKTTHISNLDIKLFANNWYWLATFYYGMGKKKEGEMVFQTSMDALQSLSSIDKGKELLHLGGILTEQQLMGKRKEMVDEGYLLILEEIKNGLPYEDTFDYIFEISSIINDIRELDENRSKENEKRVKEILQAVPEGYLRGMIYLELVNECLKSKTYNEAKGFLEKAFGELNVQMQWYQHEGKVQLEKTKEASKRTSLLFEYLEKFIIYKIRYGAATNEIEYMEHALDEWIRSNHNFDSSFSMFELYSRIFTYHKEFDMSHSLLQQFIDLANTEVYAFNRIEYTSHIINYLVQKSKWN
jgi:tetratricopeptide (TPR) repeat protein